MVDVVMRRIEDNKLYLMMPGQAFPADCLYEGANKLWQTHLYLYSCMLSKGKYYTDRKSSPMSMVELQAGGVYNVANTKEGFGMTVYTFDTVDRPGVFSAKPACYGATNVEANIWHSKLPLIKYQELQRSSLCVPEDSASVFLPSLYAKLKPHVKPVPHKDVLLYDAVCRQQQWFRKTDIPMVLDDVYEATVRGKSWTQSTLASLPKAVKGFYFEAHKDELQENVLYVAYDVGATNTPADYTKLYDRKAFDNEKTFFGSTYRRYIEVPYIENDVLAPIDIGRLSVRSITLEYLMRKEKYDYINEL